MLSGMRSAGKDGSKSWSAGQRPFRPEFFGEVIVGAGVVDPEDLRPRARRIQPHDLAEIELTLVAALDRHSKAFDGGRLEQRGQVDAAAELGLDCGNQSQCEQGMTADFEEILGPVDLIEPEDVLPNFGKPALGIGQRRRRFRPRPLRHWQQFAVELAVDCERERVRSRQRPPEPCSRASAQPGRHAIRPPVV